LQDCGTGKKKINITSFEIQNQLVKQGVNISARTIRQHLVEAGGYFAPMRVPSHYFSINKGCSSSKNIEKCFVLLSILKKCMYEAVFLVRGLIYKKGLLPSAQKFFDEGNKRWILQEDNDPKYRSIIAKK
ncbi:8238_t:CDS:2, partial [Cetraspora pellucida]